VVVNAAILTYLVALILIAGARTLVRVLSQSVSSGGSLEGLGRLLTRSRVGLMLAASAAKLSGSSGGRGDGDGAKDGRIGPGGPRESRAGVGGDEDGAALERASVGRDAPVPPRESRLEAGIEEGDDASAFVATRREVWAQRAGALGATVAAGAAAVLAAAEGITPRRAPL
jgi:hypothetical protein